MVWIIGGGILYLILVVTLGVMTIRKGHWIMFIIGIFLPFFWLIGALMPARGPTYLGSQPPGEHSRPPEGRRRSARLPCLPRGRTPQVPGNFGQPRDG